MITASGNLSVFDAASLKDAKFMSLTSDAGMSNEERWEIETRHLLSIMRRVGCFPVPGSRVLDYGCGAGRMAREMVMAGCIVIGVDQSEAMRTFAAEYVNDGTKFKAVDPRIFSDLVNSGMKFDLALCIWVLQHIRYPLHVIANIRRCLNNNGRLFLVDSRQRAIPGEDNWISDGIDVVAMVSEEFRRVTSECLWPDKIGKMNSANAIVASYEAK